MNWLDRAEVKFGHLAIPGLVRIVVGFNALVFVLYKFSPGFLETLAFNIPLIRHGQVWRLVTYLFIPGFGSSAHDWIFVLIYLNMLWFFGDRLEEAMGSFKLNAFYLLGMAAATLGAWFAGTGEWSNGLLNTTLLLAVARFYPDLVIYLMLFIPMKMKWLATFSVVALVLGFVLGEWPYRFVLMATVGNYFLFFGPEIVRDARHRGQVAQRRERFESESIHPDEEPLHRCAVCGRTEQSAPDLEFRVSRDGHEYCRQHLPQTAPTS